MVRRDVLAWALVGWEVLRVARTTWRTSERPEIELYTILVEIFVLLHLAWRRKVKLYRGDEF